MKKAVWILIGVIYCAGIVLVSIFGMALRSYDVIVYPESVEFINEGIVSVPNLDKPGESLRILTVKVPSAGEYPAEGLRFQLQWRVAPDNVTSKAVTFTISLPADKDGNINAEIGADGMLTFKKYFADQFKVTVYTAGGGAVRADTINIRQRR
jgi:hypothetical protein